ncbi:MAG: glutamine-hydrolyzing carbamoyl-phosphate synthase small subunit [Ignavibacteria bacterium]|nr:glutamine-hydrolyzing carbamoyl-phosphate synthase small subunit [Ignavibacteria bacterium]
MTRVPALLALENGMIIAGDAIGAIGAECSGELVFNTAMTGYQEILTDPSYCSQVVTFTYPHIGNYGVNDDDVESSHIQAAGIVVHELSRVVSNYRANRPLQEYLEMHGIAGIEGVDTRHIVRILRQEGAMRCVIAHGENLDGNELVERARRVSPMAGTDLTNLVTAPQPYQWNEVSAEDFRYAKYTVEHRYNVVAVDFGIKRNIMRRLTAYGCDVTVVPASTSAEEILNYNPDGVFLSNGPGDPAAVLSGIQTVKALLGKKPVFGICLGHQIMALALGAATYKLKFGHRGANHPVMNLKTRKIEITSQNHGFSVDHTTLPGNVEMTHVNLNDNTCAGIALTDAPAFAVQYHPEASPGPHDSDYLFRDFVEMMPKR